MSKNERPERVQQYAERLKAASAARHAGAICTCPRDDPWQRDCPVHGEKVEVWTCAGCGGVVPGPAHELCRSLPAGRGETAALTPTVGRDRPEEEQ